MTNFVFLRGKVIEGTEPKRTVFLVGVWDYTQPLSSSPLISKTILDIFFYSKCLINTVLEFIEWNVIHTFIIIWAGYILIAWSTIII